MGDTQYKGLTNQLVNALKSLYKDTEGIWDLNGSSTQPIITNGGDRQGCCTSPTLFNIYLDDAIRKWKDQFKRGVNIYRDNILNSLMYADDVAIMTENDLQRRIYLSRICEDYHLMVLKDKSGHEYT